MKSKLNRKLCTIDVLLQCNRNIKSGLPFQNRQSKNCVQRPMAEKSRWRHIRLEIKPLKLGNHASQIKSYYETLLGSHGRSFRIRPENMHIAPPGRGLTMKSYPVGNQTSLSRKHTSQINVAIYHYQEVMVAFSESVLKNCVQRLLTEKSRWRHIRLAIKPRYLRNHVA